MLNQAQVEDLVAKLYREVKVVDSFRYEDIFLVRVEHPDPEEVNYDPFFSVDPNTGIVKEFSVITDGDHVDIARAFENRSQE